MEKFCFPIRKCSLCSCLQSQSQDDKQSEQVEGLLWKKHGLSPTPGSPLEQPTFKQNLQSRHFIDAGKQLISREEQLFGSKQKGISSKTKLVQDEEDSEADLAKAYEEWWQLVTQTLKNSLSIQSPEKQEALKEAVQAIWQEEEQDKRWEEFEEKDRPPWRPKNFKQKHDALLEELVQRQMEETQLDSSINIGSSVEKSIASKRKQMKEDLLKVVTCVSSCYPEHENVCQFYAVLYHKALSVWIRDIAQYGLCDDDCFHVLRWVNHHYPDILNDHQIKDAIDHTKFDRLLPEDMITPLEQQFLGTKENKVKGCLLKALKEEETGWMEGKLPELRDQSYFCPLAIDIIQCIHGNVNTLQEVLCDRTKAQRITFQMKDFLDNYKAFHERVIKGKQTNTEAVLMANLSCITQFRDYIINYADLFPEDVKTNCLSLLMTMRDSSHNYFTSYIHADLKKLYINLGSYKWLENSECICEELLTKLDTHMQKFNNLDKKSCQELVGKLHKEFLVEYVRKIIKQKIKLTNTEDQQKAAAALCKNSESIHTRLTAAGSNMDWLKDILPKLAGLLILQDPDSIKLELINLLRDYPDLSEHHISAWLKLKTNLSASDLKKIMKCFVDCQDQLKEEQKSLQFSKTFFSKVRVK